MKVYLAGPMRGYPDLNYPAFDRAAAGLRAAGHEVFSPPDHDRAMGLGGSDNIQATFLADVTWIINEADCIVTLPGWEESLGASAEVAVAKAIGKPHRELEELS